MGNKSNKYRRRKRQARPKIAPLSLNFELNSTSVELKPPDTESTYVSSTLPSGNFSVPAIINFSIGKSPFEDNSQKMAAQLSTKPVTEPVQYFCPTVKLAESISIKSFNSMGSDDDVVYMYTVEPKKAKLIEVVDLSDENKNATEISKTRNLVLDTRSPEPNKHSKFMFDLPEIVFASPGMAKKDPITPQFPTKTGSTVEPIVDRKRKRCEMELAHCDVCNEGYNSCLSKGNCIFSSKCGHLFCTVCLKNLDPYKCIQCNESIWNLCKVYL